MGRLVESTTSEAAAQSDDDSECEGADDGSEQEGPMKKGFSDPSPDAPFVMFSPTECLPKCLCFVPCC
jgi:hypothetical protein